ncbi:MAG: GNAT family N-acetyltransferase [Acidobacteria bacterium]|uniref:GNAT family N-acetyltransferase n=1 Tax=Candidatus Polarisedimenticola svalbardensis TaxID=2886004 RepID=A0A8J7C388_9BACT|nr:GNAT family N-acetyltransferase [Candidatus Polarisedimenticola svalbardensis]
MENDSIPILETDHAVLTIPGPDQAGFLLDYVTTNQEHLAPWEPERDERYFTLEGCRTRLGMARSGFEVGVSVQFCALDRARSRMVGNCNFFNIIEGPFRACTLGYSIARQDQGTGLMREILEAGIRYMFDVRDLHRIMANHIPGNHRSEHLLRRLGFIREGYAQSYLNIDGRWQDHVLNALINPRDSGGSREEPNP